MAFDWKTELPGVFSRHADNCPIRDGLDCVCGPLGYRSSVRDWATNRRTVSPVFETLQEALAWQRDQVASQESSRGLALDRSELGALIDEFIQAAEEGTARDARNQQYTREQVRALRSALSYVDSELGTLDVQDVRRRHVQALLSQLHAAGLAPARIAAVTDALSALYAYAIRRELVGFSPVVELGFPMAENGVPQGVPQYPYRAAAPGAWTTGDIPAARPPVGDPWTPPSFQAPGQTNGGFTVPQPGAPPFSDYAWHPPGTMSYPAQPPSQEGQANGGFTMPQPAPPPPHAYGWQPPGAMPYQQPSQNQQTGPLSTMFGAPPTVADANYDATMQERWLWWTVRIVVIVFVLIALVLAAESV